MTAWSDTREPLAMTHTREGWIASDDVRLRYVEWGPPNAPAIVALHGLRSFAYTWEPVALPLSRQFRVIALDQRGRGLSDWDPLRRYVTSQYVADLEQLVEVLGLRRFVLLGHSMGGATALVYASHHHARLAGLVIEDMGPGASTSSAGSDRIRRELAATPSWFATWEQAEAYWQRIRPGISLAARRARVQHGMMADRTGGLVWRHDAEGIAHARLHASAHQQVDLWPHVAAVRCPALLVRGADSDFLSLETAHAMSARNHCIQHREVAAAGHYVHDDNLPAFQAALHDFLSRRALPAWALGGGR